MPQDIVDDQINLGKIAFVDETTAERLSRHKLLSGDIVFPRRGDIGKRALIGESEAGYLCGTGCLKISCPTKELDPSFLYLFLAQPSVVSEIESQAIGATMLNLNTETLRNVEISYPDLNTQRTIAAQLLSLQHLCENFALQIQLLEEAARLIYTEWFVSRRPPRSPQRRNQHESWHETTLEAVTNLINRGIAPAYDEASSKRVINQKCIRDGQLDLEPARTLSNDIPPEKLLQKGDILINSTGTGTLGRIAQVREVLDATTADTHITIVRPQPDIPIYFFGQQLLRLESHFTSLGEGATNQTELKRDRVKETAFLQPPKQLMLDFDNVVGPMIEQIEVLKKQITQLRQARDLLLPRLISGQLRL